jgi:hypothetical protein
MKNFQILPDEKIGKCFFFFFEKKRYVDNYAQSNVYNLFFFSLTPRYKIQFLRGKRPDRPIAYSTQYKAYKRAFDAVGIFSTKVTHAGRVSAIREIDSDNVSDNQQQRIGRWANSDKMVGCYLNNLPKQAIRSLAGFYANGSGTYYLPRAALDPPEELKKQIFPDVEKWLDAFRNKTVQKDTAGPNFLNLLVKMRTVVLQVKKKKTLIEVLL